MRIASIDKGRVILGRNVRIVFALLKEVEDTERIEFVLNDVWVEAEDVAAESLDGSARRMEYARRLVADPL